MKDVGNGNGKSDLLLFIAIAGTNDLLSKHAPR